MNRAARRRSAPSAVAEKDIEAAIGNAANLRQAGRYSEAEAICRRVLDAVPGRIEALALLGRTLKSQGRYAEAERHLRRALKHAPTDSVLHNDLGNVFSAWGRQDDAAKAYRRALANRPLFLEAQYNLANTLRVAGNTAAAIEAYRRYLELAPNDPAGAGLVLATLGVQVVPSRPPDAYVESLFNGYAPVFETELRDRLGYRGPELLRDLAWPLLQTGAKPRMLDIGCGTGLCGQAFAPLAASIDGVDLAPRMVEAAKARGLYASVAVGEAVAFLNASEARWDLMVAGDFLVYVGDASSLLLAAGSKLTAGGLFVATAEAFDGKDYVLRDTLRYAHARSYLEEVARKAGFDVAAWAIDEGRRQKGEAVPFHVFALRKTA